jgi:DNA polymerase III subunit delta'
VFDEIVEQVEAKRLLQAAMTEGPAHAYLFHGPAGVGKSRTAFAFAAELIGDRGRVERRAHPDLYVLEPLGDQIRIDEIRTLRRDLHMRPFEAAWRVYVVVSAHLLNAEAADALLKDLEEPPDYAVIVLVADELGPLPETIRSRCQLVPFTRLSERAVRALVDGWAPGFAPERATAVARVAGGRLDRAARLLDPEAAARREELLSIARSVYADPGFSSSAAASRLLELVDEGGKDARELVEKQLEWLDLPAREAELRRRRADLGAQREGVLEALDELAAWYRDLICVAVGAEDVVAHYDHLPQLREDASVERIAGAEKAVALVRETWRAYEEFNLQPKLALEALLVRLQQELGSAVPAHA